MNNKDQASVWKCYLNRIVVFHFLFFIISLNPFSFLLRNEDDIRMSSNKDTCSESSGRGGDASAPLESSNGSHSGTSCDGNMINNSMKKKRKKDNKHAVDVCYLSCYILSLTFLCLYFFHIETMPKLLHCISWKFENLDTGLWKILPLLFS